MNKFKRTNVQLKTILNLKLNSFNKKKSNKNKSYKSNNLNNKYVKAIQTAL